jgi:uncharacterized delta-60 repeat protein
MKNPVRYRTRPVGGMGVERRPSTGRLGTIVGLCLISSVTLHLFHSGATSQEQGPQSTAGDLDPSFGNRGKVITDFSGNDDTAAAVAIQADGKIVAGGTSTALGGTSDFALARYNSDGSLDPAFGSNGKVTTDFFQDNDSLKATAIDSDGKIIAAGSASRPGERPEFALARYNPDGSLDTTFGANGKTTTNLTGDDVAYAVALQADGKIVAAGTSAIHDFPKFGIARYNRDGSLDTGFGVGGKVNNSIRGGLDWASAVLVQPDNKIVIAGRNNGSTPDNFFAIFRYNANGSPDTSFGTDGAATTEASFTSGATAIALQSDGKIVAAGSAATPAFKSFFALARYNRDGSIDLTFNGFFPGVIHTTFTNGNDGATALAIQSDGKILAAGFAGGNVFFSNCCDFAMARYKRDGRLDPAFGVDGKVVTDFFGHEDSANAIALQSDGKIVLAGVARTTTNVFALARYLVEDFALAFDQPMINADRGTTVPVEIVVNREGGFIGSVTITPPDASAIGVRVKPPGPITTNHARVRVKIKVAASAALGVQKITFTGRDDEGRIRTAALTLNIQ